MYIIGSTGGASYCMEKLNKLPLNQMGSL